MENESAQTPPPETGYEEKIARLESQVKQLADDNEKKPSPSGLLELKRKSDTLLHLRNLAKGDPKARAKQAAEAAREYVQNLAIQPGP